MDDKGEFTARQRRSGVPDAEADTGGVMSARSVPQPPLSTDLLAELHADNLPPHEAEQLRAQVRKDPAAAEFLHSLDGVSAELHALGRDEHILHPMPAQVAARLDALLGELSRGEESQQVATVHRIHTERTAPGPDDDREPPSTRPMPAVEAIPADPFEVQAGEDLPGPDEGPVPIPLDEHRSKRLRWFAAAAAAVAVVAGTLVGVDAMRDRTVSPDALPLEHSAPVALGDELSSATVLSVMGRNDVTGPLSGPGAIAGCVKATVPNRTVLGSTNVTFHGEPAVLILLTGPRPPKITALVVGAGCGPEDPQILETRDIG